MAGGIQTGDDEVYPMDADYATPEQVTKNKKLRLLSFLSCMLALLSSGSLYGFSLYGDDLKENLGWTQTELNIVAGFGNNGLYVGGIIYGYYYDRYGSRSTFVHGALCGLLGYIMMYLVDKKSISSSVWLSSFFYLIIGFGSCATVTTGIAVNIKNFSAKYRGVMTGVSLAGFGLSAFLFSQINSLFYADKETPGDFLLFVGLFTFITNAVAVAFAGEFKRTDLITRTDAEKYNQDINASCEEVADVLKSPTETSLLIKPTADIGGWDILRTAAFWMLFITTTVQAGAGLMYISNVGSIVSSLGAAKGDADNDSDKNLQVAILSIANSFGRLSIGSFSDWAVKRWTNVPRSIYLYICVISAVIAQAILAFSGDIDPMSVTAPTIFNGIAYGGLLTVATIVLSEEFGTTYFGINYGLLTLGVAAGGQILNIMFGVFYDAESDKSEDNTTDSDCIGSKCYSLVMGIAMALSLVSFTCVSILVVRKRMRKVH